MNKTRYLQTDSRWSKLPFRNSPDNVGNNGCGMVSICNAIIEMKKYANYTPATMQPYCRQFVVPAGYIIADIPVTMKHYGLTDVKEHATMDSLWKELAKGDRVAVYLMGNRPGGSKKVHWTSGGHFVSSVAYQHKDGDHWVYMKDSASNSSLRNGWMSYKGNLRGDVSRVWSGKLSDAPAPSPSPDPKPTPSGKLVVDGIGGTATVRRMQEFFGTTVDGVIGGQLKVRAPYYPALQAVSFGKGGSRCIYKLQEWLGLSGPDGVIGPNTTKAWQRKLRSLGYFDNPNESIDGIFGVKSMKAWQECLNNDCKKKVSPDPTPDPKPTPTPKADKYKVIDVSEWQGVIDWAKVKADGVVGAIIRYADGDYLDKYFDRNMQMAKAQGLHIGAYIFSRASSKAGAEKEAQRLFDACKKYSPDLPLYIDLEDNSLKKYAETVAQAYISKIKALGGKPGVYANLNWWNNYLKKTAKLSFAMWLAQYNDTMDYKPKSYVGMWQYSSSGSVKGISGRVDMDWLYIPYWDKKPEPTPQPIHEPTLIDKEMDACKVQADWMKNAAYKWESKPTVPKSKKKGTCVTYVACVLQRIGILKSGQYIWQNGKGYGTGKVYGTNSKMTTTYMKNKTFTACKSKLKRGDIVLCDDNKSGEAGSGGHIMIFDSFNKDGKPLVWDNTCAKTGKRRAYGKSRKILAIVRLK